MTTALGYIGETVHEYLPVYEQTQPRNAVSQRDDFVVEALGHQSKMKFCQIHEMGKDSGSEPVRQDH